ncbi:hypothetical protein C7972_10985 [Arenibacter sp. ARW7G5Y1]|nr:hypothetical protein C7972_10985 [Arenibacter sp. ARW7G5Y1]
MNEKGLTALLELNDNDTVKINLNKFRETDLCHFFTLFLKVI